MSRAFAGDAHDGPANGRVARAAREMDRRGSRGDGGRDRPLGGGCRAGGSRQVAPVGRGRPRFSGLPTRSTSRSTRATFHQAPASGTRSIVERPRIAIVEINATSRRSNIAIVVRDAHYVCSIRKARHDPPRFRNAATSTACRVGLGPCAPSRPTDPEHMARASLRAGAAEVTWPLAPPLFKLPSRPTVRQLGPSQPNSSRGVLS